MTKHNETLAARLCDDFDARTIAGQEYAPLFQDSPDHVQAYWRAIASAALSPAAGQEPALREALEPCLQAIAKSGKVEDFDRHHILMAVRSTLPQQAATDEGEGE